MVLLFCVGCVWFLLLFVGLVLCVCEGLIGVSVVVFIVCVSGWMCVCGEV